jgi:hypothetical protein
MGRATPQACWSRAEGFRRSGALADGAMARTPTAGTWATSTQSSVGPNRSTIPASREGPKWLKRIVMTTDGPALLCFYRILSIG